MQDQGYLHSPGDRVSSAPYCQCSSLQVDLQSKVRALTSPLFYDHWTRRVDVVETHYACVFLTDTFAYKLKKPIRAGRLDQSTLAARYVGCCEEVRLNRRLAPHIYLGVEPLTCDADLHLGLRGAGRIVDWLVKMRRLPAELMLDEALRRGEVRSERLDAVGRLLTAFYRSQSPLPCDAETYLLRM